MSGRILSARRGSAGTVEVTRRELAKRLSADTMNRGPHYQEGSTIYRTDGGDWGAFAGPQKPPNAAQFFEWVGWDQRPRANTVLRVETTLKRLEQRHTGKAARVQRRTLRQQG